MAGPPHRRLLVLFLLFTQAVSVIYTYKDVALPPESVLVSTHGLFGAANGDSAFVNVDLRFEIEAREKYLDVAQTMEVFLIKHGAKNAQEYYSCDHKTGRVAIKNGAKSVQDTDSQLEVPVRLVRRTVSKYASVRFPILADGKYSLLVARCQPSRERLVINGEVEWLSQYGELPGEYAKLLPFYGLITLIYFITTILWYMRVEEFKGSLIPLQYAIFVVLGFNFLEALACFINFYSANLSGRLLDSGPLFLLTEIVRVLADTICRAFLLVVCMGLGVVVQKLNAHEEQQVAGFTITYFVLKLTDHLSRVTPASISELLLLMDCMLLVWLFVSLSKAEAKLRQEDDPNSEIKLEMYESTRLLLIIFLMVTVLCFGALYHMYDILPWTWSWIRHSFEDCIVFLIVFYMAIAWLPSEETIKYAPVEMEMATFSAIGDSSMPVASSVPTPVPPIDL